MAFLVPSGRVVTSSCLTYCERASGLSVSIECIAADDKQYRMAMTYQTLGVFTDNDHVDLLAILTRNLSSGVSSFGQGSAPDVPRGKGPYTYRSYRSDVGVKIHVLSQGNDRARVSSDLVRGGRDGSEHGSVTFFLEGTVSCKTKTQ